MDINKANEAAKLVQKIDKCKKFLKSLDGRSYNDEFVIYYRGAESCELEEPALELLINYYKNELSKAEKQLQSL